MHFVVFLLTTLIIEALSLPETIKIAGIFDDGHSKQTYDAFMYATQAATEGRRGMNIGGSALVPRNIPDFQPDLLSGPPQVCAILEEGVMAIFGPQRRLSTLFISSIANETAIPHLTTRWSISKRENNFGINLHPDHVVTGRALSDLVRHFNWSSFALIYDDTESLVRASGLLDGMNELKPVPYKLNPQNITHTLSDVKQSGTSFIVLDCPGKVAVRILRSALKMDMINFYFHYVLTSWDIHLLEFQEFVEKDVNITAFQLLDFDDPHLLRTAKGWVQEDSKLELTTEAALMYDAVHVFTKAAKKVDEETGLSPESINCFDGKTWTSGRTLLRALLKTKVRGLSGNITFDENGRRSEVTLHIVEPLRLGLKKVGDWTMEHGVKINFNYTGYRKLVQSPLKSRVLKVLAKLSFVAIGTFQEPPYVMEKENASLYFGNDRYRGFCVDLLQNLSVTLNFTYRLIVTDLNYGAQDPVTKEWNGLIRKLIDKEGDMVLGALTITRDREEVVDFSQPFLYLGVKILLKKPEKKPTALFSFLDPLNTEVWIAIVAAYVVTSIVMFVIGRFSPYEWYNPNPCVEEAGVVENQFSVFNALWFGIGSLMQEGTEIAPRAISTRFLAGIWWFFTMIIVGSYTANLAAFLTAERMKLPIESAHDLAKQNQIKYGCLEGGATCSFFEKSVYPDYVRMWDAIKSDSNNFVKTHEEGVAKVKETTTGSRGYAYLLESITLDYITSRDCSLIGIGNPLDTKGYGVAFPKNSPFREEISVSILTQQDKGFLEEFRIKWWKQEDGGITCEDIGESSGASAMGMDKVGGVFVVVMIGIAMGIVTALTEFCWKTAKRVTDERKEPILVETARAFKSAFQSPFARSKVIVRPATAIQLREQDLSTAVPILPNKQYGYTDTFH